MAKSQTKSKERVAEHGEVFTAEREVKAMCDLVENMCEDYSKRFLEPACGDGNFLAEILTRKLNSVKKKYKRSTYDYERFSVFAETSSTLDSTPSTLSNKFPELFIVSLRK